MTKILTFAGSARADSLNKRLARHAAAMAEAQGAEATFVDLRDYPLPLYDGDLEAAEGIPEAATRFKELLRGHDGWVIACPEYNSSITPLLKNTIDWCSRPADGEPMLAAFQGKVVNLLAASPGGLGGLRGLVHVRSILSNLGMVVIPHDIAIPKAHEALDADQITDERTRNKVQAAVAALIETTAKLHG